MTKILEIKLGALGDFIQAAGPFAAIRKHHPDAEITLLTSAAFADLAQASPWFDKVEIDTKPRALNIGKWMALRKWLLSQKFSRIYDLQTSDRSGFYFKLYWPKSAPEWSGIARGCSHPHSNPERDLMHTYERQREQLDLAGIPNVSESDFSWINEDISRFKLNENFALLMPGGAAHRPAKRWPEAHYQEIVRHLTSQNIQPVLIGGKDEAALLEKIASTDPLCRSLSGETTISDLFALAQKAKVAIGNDTGPMHAAAATGCATIVLFSAASDPSLCAQRGPQVKIMRAEVLDQLKPSDIIEQIDQLNLTSNPRSTI